MVPRKVFLIGWDAADWKVIQPLMDAGKMPNAQRLMANGVAGQIATLHPPLSPMLWTSIATGKRPFKHGILGFAEPTPDGRGVRPVTNLSRKSKALWNILSQNDLRSVVVGWWPSHPAEPINGVMVSDHYHRARGPFDQGWPLIPNTIHPPEMAEALAALRMHPDLLTPAMVEPFIPLAKEIDQDQDQRLAGLMRTLAECMSIHSAATWLLDNQPWDFFAVYFDAIDHFCHGFMRYHPPRQSWIAQRDFELYHNVVSIPDIPAGPAIEHRDFGILAMRGPGLKKNQALHGSSVLDIAPTILNLFGLPVGQDMDGKVLSEAFVKTPKVAWIPSWEEVPGADGRHPPHTRLDPVAAHAALEQMIALGYIERPDTNREVAVEKTIRELRYNLGEAYQDDDRHLEARAIFSQLWAADPDEQRFAVRLFVSCQALGMHDEMRRIASDLEGRPERFQAPVIDYLKAQVLTAEQRYEEALEALERVTEAHLVRPSVLLQTADLYLRLGRWRDAQQVYEKALAIDPDNAQAHAGKCRIALRRKEFSSAAHSALDALQRVHHYPVAHFLLGRALTGMEQYERAAEAFRAAIFLNPNFPEAHARLALLLEKHLNDRESARDHRRLARRMRSRRTEHLMRPPVAEKEQSAAVISGQSFVASTSELLPLEESLIVVTGLPRSGTSMLMQMLAAGGMSVFSDGLREADEDNPRGYLEFERTKNLLQDSKWLFEARGKAIKIVVPLLAGVPQELASRVILSERDLDEVLDSQERMLVHGSRPAMTPERRRMLKDEYARTLGRVKAMLSERPGTHLLVVEHSDVISNPLLTAARLNTFLGGKLDVAKMAAAIDPALHRIRSGVRV